MWKENHEQLDITNKNNIIVNEVNSAVKYTENQVQEIIDIFDEETYKKSKQLKVIKSIDKKEAHELWELHWVTHVWIIDENNEIILQKVSKDKEINEKWTLSAAWHLKKNETPKKWWVREIFEELWISVNEEDLIPLWTYKKSKWKIWSKKWLNKEIIFAYLLRISNKTIFNLDEKEVEKIQFMDINKFESEILDSEKAKKYSKNKRYFQNIINKIRDNITE